MNLSRSYPNWPVRGLLVALAVAAASLFLVRPGTARADLPIARDDFEDEHGSWTGLGWLNQWQFDNAQFTFSNDPHSGFAHIRVQEPGSVTRRFDISGESNIWVKFWARAEDLDSATAYAEVSADGSTFVPLQTWASGDDDEVYRSYGFPLTDSGLSFEDEVWVRFRVDGTGSSGDLYVDDIEAVSVGEVADAPPPGGPDDPVAMDSQFADWAGKAMLADAVGDQEGSSRHDVAALYWANNIDGEVNYHMIERATTDGQPFSGSNGQRLQGEYILYVDTNDDGDFIDSGDRRVQVTYNPKNTDGKVRVKVYRATSPVKISDSGWQDWGETRGEGGLRFEFAVDWNDLGISFGDVVRMYLVSYDGRLSSPDVKDRVPDGSGDIQWSPASVLGIWLLAAAAALGFAVIWYFRGRRQWISL